MDFETIATYTKLIQRLSSAEVISFLLRVTCSPGILSSDVQLIAKEAFSSLTSQEYPTHERTKSP